MSDDASVSPPPAPESATSPPPAKPNAKHGLIGLAVIGGVIALVVYAVVAHHSSASPTGTPGGGQVASSPASPEDEAKRLATMAPAEVPAEVTRIMQERNKINQTYEQFAAEHPPFQINGSVKDRDENSATIFGMAIPDGGDLRLLGTLTDEGNLYVISPNKNGFIGSNYVGSHYFLKKGEGTNAFGAQVPVFIYGPEPKEAATLRSQSENVNEVYNLARRFWYAKANNIGVQPGLNEAGWKSVVDALGPLDSLTVDGLGIGSELSAVMEKNPTVVTRGINADYYLCDQGLMLTFKLDGEKVKGTAWALTVMLSPEKMAAYYNIPKEMKASAAAMKPTVPFIQVAGDKQAWDRLGIAAGRYFIRTYNRDTPELWAMNIPQRSGTSDQYQKLLIALSEGMSTNIIAVTIYRGEYSDDLPFTLESRAKDPLKP